MPRAFIKRLLPRDEQIRQHRHLRFLGTLLHDGRLWHLNRRSVAGAASVGLFMAWIPVPFQMLLAAMAAIVLRLNLPVSVVLVWITNPLTMPPMFYFAYLVGAFVLGQDRGHFQFELSVDWLMNGLSHVWQPFLLGCLILAVTSAVIGHVLVRLLWRWHVTRSWLERREERARIKARQQP